MSTWPNDVYVFRACRICGQCQRTCPWQPVLMTGVICDVSCRRQDHDRAGHHQVILLAVRGEPDG